MILFSITLSQISGLFPLAIQYLWAASPKYQWSSCSSPSYIRWFQSFQLLGPVSTWCHDNCSFFGGAGGCFLLEMCGNGSGLSAGTGNAFLENGQMRCCNSKQKYVMGDLHCSCLKETFKNVTADKYGVKCINRYIVRGAVLSVRGCWLMLFPQKEYPLCVLCIQSACRCLGDRRACCCRSLCCGT